MSYSNKHLVRINFPLFDFGGAANEVMSFKIPKDEHGNNQKARLVDVGVMVTEIINADTTEPAVLVGTAGDNDAYAQLNITDATADEACFNVDNDANAILNEDIPSGTLVEMNFKFGAETAGSLTGQGIPYVDMYVW